MGARLALSLSLSQKLLGGLLAISLAFTATGSVAAYVMFRDRAEQMRVTDLSLYVKQRTKSEQAMFDQLRGKHQSASRPCWNAMTTWIRSRRSAISTAFSADRRRHAPQHPGTGPGITPAATGSMA